MKTIDVMKNLGVLLCFGMALPALAESPQLSGEEIEELLSGNSAVYEDGALQFFDESGRTTYKNEGSPIETGTWRASKSHYCSRWGVGGPVGGEACYVVRYDGETITFNGKYPGHIRAGDVFEDPPLGGIN